ncbi:transglycosylase SLT domain-containing protein [Silvibacterium acidisoli]|uniref:transglycosylase SLT domain-containing protein n=1 Tax=Acidobacteriaceae bacterium ZG23-2 TaxID=2883246 RepID=UPI00406C2CDC
MQLPALDAPQSPTQNAGAQTTAPPPVSPAIRQRDQQLILNVDKAYMNGLANYHDGHISAAKANFDYAVDLMLSSGIDIKNDPELSDEFDRIVDAVNTLEVDALKQGNGLAPSPAEETPAAAANAATFTVDPTVRAEAEASLKTTQSDFPLVMNDYVASFINFFSNTRAGHGTIVASLNRAGRYKAMIQQVLREEGVPQDLIYLAVAESGFRPQAMNPSGAGGMWQFMPWGTYGLDRNGWVDERFDPEKATRAYAREIKKAYAQTGDWYLAMASYNWGTGNVQRAVQRTGYADFWELYKRNNLPEQTKNYVPEILAVIIMSKNPKQYGLNDLTPDPPLVMDTVQTNYSVDLRLVADITGVPVQEIVGLNPSLLRGATPPDDAYDLHIPAGTKALFEQRIAEIPEDKRRYWRFHKLVEGETVQDVAKSYHVPASEIAFVNQLSSTTDLDGVDALIVPVAPASSPSSARNALYRTRGGDTLVTVADRFGVTVEQLRRWNHLRSNAIPAGRSLYVAEPARISTASRRSRRGSSRGSAGASHGKNSRGTSNSKGTAAKPSAHASSPAPKHKHK